MLGFMKSTVAAAALTTSATLLFSNVVLADDSEFELDPRLHQSFWGFAYTPENSAYYPNCGDTIEQVVRDMQLMSQLTTRVRLYGSDCQQLELVMEAIRLTKTNLHIFPGIFIDGNETTYERQRDTTFEVLDKYGVDGVLGITVGNEYILQQFTEDPAQRAEAEALVISKIADVKEILASKGYSKEIPVGTADAGSQITEELSAAADYIMANTHPFFSGINIEGAAEWTNQFLVNDEPRFATEAGKTLYNAEIGWPTNADAGGELSFNGSAASIENLQILLDTFVCQANQANDFGYFYFELFDAEWKKRFLGAEPYWGLFDSSAERVLKDGITIPDCPAEAAPLLAGANEVPGSGGGENTETGGGGSNNGGSGNGNGNGGSFGVKEHSVQWGVGALVGGLVMLGGFAMF